MRFLFTILFVIYILRLGSQTSVNGRVVDADYRGIEFVNIVSYDLADTTVIMGATVSDSLGAFSLDVNPNMESILRFSFIGFEDRDIRVPGNGLELGDIVMEQSAVEMESVEVTARRPLIRRESDKLILNVEYNVLAQGNDVMELLAKAPGVVIDFNDNIMLGGKNGVRIQIDGRDTRLSGADLGGLLRSMSASNIEELEIITNPSARYEASGNAGIINIVTKQSRLYGTNGNFELSPGYGRHFRWQNAMMLNHRNAKTNIYANYSYSNRDQYMEIIQDRTYINNGVEDSRLEIQNDFRMPIRSHNLRLGLDYDFSKDVQLTLSWTANRRKDGSDTENEILNFNRELNFSGSQETTSMVRSDWTQDMLSAYLKTSIGSKTKLNLSLDAAHYTNGSRETYISDFLDARNEISYTDLLSGEVNGFLKLGGLALDLKRTISDDIQIETGLKSTIVRTDNDLYYTNTVDGVTEVNTDLSNRFIYDENINAAYFSMVMSGKKWNTNIGLRLEDSNIEGNQLTTDSMFAIDYINLFPSASFNYNLNAENSVGISISRRIDRPGYNQLNPFRFFVNTNTFRSGNPFLQPQFTWSTELSYTFKQRYYMAFNVSHTLDNLNHGIIRDGDKELVLITPLNIEKQTSYSLILSLPVSFTTRWTSHWNLQASLLDFDGLVNSSIFNRSTLISMLNTNHNIELGKGYRFQFGGFIMPPHYISITKVKTIASLNAGIQKSVLNGKGRVRINVNDIFYTYYPQGRTEFGGIDDAWISYRDNQVISMSFSMDFGKVTVRPPKRNRSAVQSELNRIGSMNGNG